MYRWRERKGTRWLDARGTGDAEGTRPGTSVPSPPLCTCVSAVPKRKNGLPETTEGRGKSKKHRLRLKLLGSRRMVGGRGPAATRQSCVGYILLVVNGWDATLTPGFNNVTRGAGVLQTYPTPLSDPSGPGFI